VQSPGKDALAALVFPTPFVGKRKPYEDFDDFLFWCGWDEDKAKSILLPPARTVAERRLDLFTSAIRTKPAWWEKVNDESIVSKWRSEAAEQHIDASAFEFAMKVR
jgi:hypothetical protein